MQLPKLHVAAGTFHAARSGPIALQAFLGTCIGVTLFDPEARVGGLIHLLLPEPAGGATTFQPEKYASFGLPLFLRALIDLGAAPERMHAVMAGGALVGPVTDQDLGLDIGGRTSEITRRILKQAGIGIQRSETGGFFTCRLSLDMQTGESRIEPVGPETGKAIPERPPQPPTRKRILERIDRIQPIPQVALKIMRILSKEDWDIRAVIAEVQKDQVIGAQVLRLCNSPMIAPPWPVASIDHALVLIGSANLQKFVIAAALEGFFAQTRTGYSLCKGGLYYHSIGTAIISENLARITGKSSPSLAYSAGLLHDIGKVALDQYIGSALPFFYRSMQEDSQDSLEIERRLLGMDHTEAGALLAERWKLPAEIAEVIRGHHEVAAQGSNQNPLVAIVALANGLMRHFNAGMQLGRLCASDVHTALFALGLAGDGLASVVDRMPPAVFGADPEKALIQSTDRRKNPRPVDPPSRDETP